MSDIRPANMFGTPEPAAMPPVLHDEIAAVRSARAAWIAASVESRDSELANESADHDHHAALREAAAQDEAPASVEDQRPAKAQRSKAAGEALRATRGELDNRWRKYLASVRLNRQAVVDHLDPEVSAASEVAAASLADYELDLAKVLGAAGLRSWVSGVLTQPTNSTQGPRPLRGPSEPITELRRAGQILGQLRHAEAVSEAKQRQRTGQLRDSDYDLLSLSRV